MTDERTRVTKLEDKIDNLSDRITTLQMDLIETRYAVKKYNNLRSKIEGLPCEDINERLREIEKQAILSRGFTKWEVKVLNRAGAIIGVLGVLVAALALFL